jgi:hypothetical protein
MSEPYKYDDKHKNTAILLLRDFQKLSISIISVLQKEILKQPFMPQMRNLNFSILCPLHSGDLPLTSIKVKNEWSHTSTPPHHVLWSLSTGNSSLPAGEQADPVTAFTPYPATLHFVTKNLLQKEACNQLKA